MNPADPTRMTRLALTIVCACVCVTPTRRSALRVCKVIRRRANKVMASYRATGKWNIL